MSQHLVKHSTAVCYLPASSADSDSLRVWARLCVPGQAFPRLGSAWQTDEKLQDGSG